jgi:hypothetical protein
VFEAKAQRAALGNFFSATWPCINIYELLPDWLGCLINGGQAIAIGMLRV